MTTPRKTPADAARQPRTTREGAVIVAAVGIIVAVTGHAATGIGIVAVAALVFAIGWLTKPPTVAADSAQATRQRLPRDRPARRRGRRR